MIYWLFVAVLANLFVGLVVTMVFRRFEPTLNRSMDEAERQESRFVYFGTTILFASLMWPLMLYDLWLHYRRWRRKQAFLREIAKVRRRIESMIDDVQRKMKLEAKESYEREEVQETP
jgi:hypothetical protein